MKELKAARSARGIRTAVQLGFLALSIALFVIGRLQLWFVIFAAGLAVSLVFGRLYCGWVCPMNTLFRPIAWFYRKTGLKRLKIPAFLTKGTWRFLPLAIFLAFMVLSRRMEVHTPPLLILTLLSLLATLFFEEALWHNSLCPFGTLLSISARAARRSYRIAEAECIGCGKCDQVCPVHAIDRAEGKKRRIRKQDCISCGRCASVCPTDAIPYS